MDNNATAIPSRLEILPDEILLEVFKYIEPIDLRSFVGHNQRMNNVIKDVKLNMIIEYPDAGEEDFDYLKSFLPNQFIRLELRYRWKALSLNVYVELRSLKLDCDYLSEHQFDQVLTINLPTLERLAVDNVPHYYGKELLLAVLDNERLPSLKICRLSTEFCFMLEFNALSPSPNNTIRTLILSRWEGSQLGLLLNLIPNLRRFEATFPEALSGSLDLNSSHIPLEYLRMTLKVPSNDLEKMLPYMSNLKQLRVTGMITEDSILEHFEKLAKIFRSHVPNLQHFDCELYFHAWDEQVDVIAVQQLHPLFKTIQCHFGSNINQCYATDLSEYPPYSEYAHVNRATNYSPVYSGGMRGYDSDREFYNDYNDDDNDNNNGWVNYGLGYRGNYKANYGSSPWSGNNDD